MTALWGVLKRDVRIAFTTPTAWIVVFAFTLITSLLFWMQLLQFEGALQRALELKQRDVLALLDFHELVLGGVWMHVQELLLFLMPLLTMRAFADEKRQGTLDLLLASPARTWQLVAGKIGAVVVIVLCLCAILLVYPCVLAWLGHSATPGESVIDAGAVASGLCGVLLTGALYASVGVLFSSLTSSATVAALLTFLTLAFLWFMGGASGALDGTLGVVLSALSPASHMERFVRGAVALVDVTYFVTGIVVAFVACVHIVDDGRQR